VLLAAAAIGMRTWFGTRRAFFNFILTVQSRCHSKKSCSEFHFQVAFSMVRSRHFQVGLTCHLSFYTLTMQKGHS